MIEKTIKMQKDNIIKDIPENLVSDYIFMGWTIVEEDKKSFKIKEDK